MTRPRSEQLDLVNGGFCHLGTRCVRQAYLLGKDRATDADFSHRAEWVERRLLHLSTVFAVEVFAYAVMSNHYHLVLGFHPAISRLWQPEEIAERWLRLYPKENDYQRENFICSVESNSSLAERLRIQLSGPSLFMKGMNQHIANMANKEEQKAGKFWGTRYFSESLESMERLIYCMAYVDLNPFTAGMVPSPEHLDQRTSLVRRLQEQAFSERPRTGQSGGKLLKADATTHEGTAHLGFAKTSVLPPPVVSGGEIAQTPLRPLTQGEGATVCRLLDSGTNLEMTYATYRHYVCKVANEMAKRPKTTAYPPKNLPPSSSWEERWLHNVDKFRFAAWERNNDKLLDDQ